jgi:hypothetical protein
MRKDELTEILGWEPGRSMRLEILQKVKETGKSIQEVASNYQLPEMFIKDNTGLIEYKGEKMTPEQFQEKHPYRKFVTIGTRKVNENN